MIINLAERAHNHNFEADWICRSLLDTDFYKLLMLQFIWKHFPRVQVTFTAINRTKGVALADEVPEPELRRQLDHARTRRVTKSELIWLAGNTFYGQRGIFEPAFLEWLADFALPPYELTRDGNQWCFQVTADWGAASMWEIPALAIMNELRTRAALATLSEFELDILYARAKAKLWEKIARLQDVPGLRLTDFGTRRRHSFLWQDYVVQALVAELGPAYLGTSNALLAMRHDQEAMGTNAHELPMVLTSLAEHGRLPIPVRQAQYEVLRLWQATYGGALRVMLPDTFGTTQFLQGAPDWVAAWTGLRVDSKDPFLAGEEYLEWLRERGQDPATKLLLFSDGLDMEPILHLHAAFGGQIRPGHRPQDFTGAADFRDPGKWLHRPRVRDAYGWGTLLTNDFRGCHPRGLPTFDPISLVCKVSAVEGHPAVKLSDNAEKAIGPEPGIARYREIFGAAGLSRLPVVV
jgi:nicotinate phosphoribosyltransferase